MKIKGIYIYIEFINNLFVMKKLLLIPLFFILIKNSAQTYVTFSDSVATWNVFDQMFPGSPTPTNTNVSYVMLGDTVLGSENYKKIYYSCNNYPYNIAGALREDSLRNIWFRTFASSCEYNQFYQDTLDILLYSFNNYSIGDTIWTVNNPDYEYWVLQNIGTEMVSGINRLTYEVYHPNFNGGWSFDLPSYGEKWISGIGSMYSLLSPININFESSNITTCYEDDLVSWLNPYVDSCILPLAIGIEENIIDISISPNPVVDELFINSEKQIKAYAIYNLSGKLLVTSNKSGNRIPMKKFARGVYIVEISTDKGIVRKRVVKE